MNEVKWSRSMKHSLQRTLLTERERDALTLRRKGYTLKGIGEELGISTTRARQLVIRANRKGVSKDVET